MISLHSSIRIQVCLVQALVFEFTPLVDTSLSPPPPPLSLTTRKYKKGPTKIAWIQLQWKSAT